VQQNSRCLHRIIVHIPDTDKHSVCTALAATKSLHKYGVCILTTGAAFKVVGLSIKNQQSSLTANRVNNAHHNYLKSKAKPP